MLILDRTLADDGQSLWVGYDRPLHPESRLSARSMAGRGAGS